jgi:tripartite-type tricarboxylate transporter receptor subunit TctC
MPRRRFGLATLALAACAFASALAAGQPAQAQPYPSRTITVVVAFAPGGFADSVGRLVAQHLGERLGQTVVVENRAGAGGNIGARYVAGANPDGYTLLVTTTAIAINEALYKTKGFAAADFKPIAVVTSSPESMTTAPDNPGATIGEFLAARKDRPINFGSAGVGSGSHIAAEYMFKVLAKVPATHVPFQGGAPAVNAAIANHIDMLAGTLGGGIAAQINAGKLKGLGIASETRAAVTPQVPTLAEGGVPGLSAASWVGVFAPANVPADVAAKLNATIDAVVGDQEIARRLQSFGLDPVRGNVAEADAFVKAETEKWGRMVRTLNLSIE